MYIYIYILKRTAATGSLRLKHVQLRQRHFVQESVLGLADKAVLDSLLLQPAASHGRQHVLCIASRLKYDIPVLDDRVELFLQLCLGSLGRRLVRSSLGALPTHHFSPALLGLESVDRLLRRGDVLLKVMSQSALQHFKRLALAHLREIQLLLLLLDALVQLRHHLRGNAMCWACVGHTRPQEQRSGVCLVQAGDGCTHLSAETC